MKRNLIIRWFALGLLFQHPLFSVFSQEIQWQPAGGPYGGQVYNLAVRPGGVLYAGTDGSIFRSMDAGENWDEVYQTSEDIKFPILSLCVNGLGHVFAGTPYGVIRSLDEGGHWTTVLEMKWINSITSKDTGFVFAKSDSGIFRSLDNGDTWTPVLLETLKPNRIDGVTVHPTGSVFIHTAEGIYRSTDNGETWTKLGAEIPKGVIRLEADPKGNLFAAVAKAGVSFKSDVFFSSDNGETWIKQGAEFKKIVKCLMPDPKGNLFAAVMKEGISPKKGGHSAVNEGIYGSSDSGNTWLPMTNGLTYLDVNCLAVDSSGRLFAGTLGGIFKSIDAGKNWSVTNRGINKSTVHALALHPNGSIFAGTTSSGIYRSDDDGKTWNPKNSGFLHATVLSLLVLPDGTILAGTADGLSRSMDNGENWIPVDKGLKKYTVRSLAVDNLGQVFAGTEGYGIYRSNDSGVSWKRMSDNLDPWDKVQTSIQPVQVYAMATNQKGYIYAGTSNRGLLASNDRGDSWMTLNTGVESIYSITVDPVGLIWAGSTDGKILFTQDDGLHWVPLKTDMPADNIVPSLVADSLSHVFAGTCQSNLVTFIGSHMLEFRGGSVYRSAGQDASWMKVSGGLPSTGIFSLCFDRHGHLLAGTQVFGIYRTTEPVSAIK